MSSGFKKYVFFGVFRKLKKKKEIPRRLIFEFSCKNCEILLTWNSKVNFGHYLDFHKTKLTYTSYRKFYAKIAALKNYIFSYSYSYTFFSSFQNIRKWQLTTNYFFRFIFADRKKRWLLWKQILVHWPKNCATH